MSAKAEYAVRAMVELAADHSDAPVRAEDIAGRQGIPVPFLLSIFGELRAGQLLLSKRGREGGWSLARSPQDITVADVMRCIDGPIVVVSDRSLSKSDYEGAAESLIDVWRALRASARSVLEHVSLAEVVSGELHTEIRQLADDYLAQEQTRRH